MTIIVTGGAGFIGSNFIHYLLKRYDDINIVNIDLLTYAGIERNAVIAGIGDHVQIWNDEAWDAKEQEMDPAEMEELFCQLGL